MKCPQCNIRNSVAATQCKDCGTKLPRKSLSLTDMVKTTMSKLPAITAADLDSADTPAASVELTGAHVAIQAPPRNVEPAGSLPVAFESNGKNGNSNGAGYGDDNSYVSGNGNGNGHAHGAIDPYDVAPAESDYEEQVFDAPVTSRASISEQQFDASPAIETLPEPEPLSEDIREKMRESIREQLRESNLETTQVYGSIQEAEAYEPVVEPAPLPPLPTPAPVSKAKPAPAPKSAPAPKPAPERYEPVEVPVATDEFPQDPTSTGERLPVLAPIQVQAQSQTQSRMPVVSGEARAAAEDALSAVYGEPGATNTGELFPGLQKKPGFKLPVSPKIAIGIAAALAIGVGAFALVPMFTDSEGNLEKVARKVAAGPKSGSDAEHIKSELESTAKEFLEKNTKLTSAELTVRLQKIFPNSAFETRVFDLPHDMRLVEIDTMLQAQDYLMSGKHVALLRNFEVFDTAKVVEQGGKQSVVLLGHRNAQAGRRPQVRVFDVENDNVVDKTQESVPPISGDGNATFDANGQDINLDLSLMSKAGEERLFTIDSLSKGPLTDENVKSKLSFVNGKYEISEERGTGQLAALRAAAFMLTDASAKARFRRYFVDGVLANATSFDKLKVNPPLFTIKQVGSTAGSSGGGESRRSRRHRRHGGDSGASSGNAGGSSGTVTYLLNNGQDAFEVTMGSNGARYLVTNIKRAKASAADSSQMVVEAKPQLNNTEAVVTKTAPSGPVEETMVPSSKSDATLNNSKVVTKVDEFGSKKIVEVLPATPTSGNNAATTRGAENKVAVVESKSSAPEAGHINDEPSITTVKVRTGAGRSFKSIGEVSRNQNIQIIGKTDEWYKIQYNGGEGYVFGNFVSKGAAIAAAAPAVTAPTPRVEAAPETKEHDREREREKEREKDRRHDRDVEKSHSETASAGSGKGGSLIRKSKSVWDANSRHVGDVNPGDRVTIIGNGSHSKYKVRLANGNVGYLDRSAVEGSGAVMTEEAPVRSSHSGHSSHSSRAAAAEPQAEAPASSKSSRSSHSHKSSSAPKASKPAASEAPPQFVP